MHPVQAYAALQAKGDIVSHIIQRRSPKDHDVVIDVHYCGICHSDIHQVNGDWGPNIFPMVPGHEITGVVKHIGAKVKKFKIGDRVGVGCMVDSCQTCSSCQKQEEQFCEQGFTSTYNDYEKNDTQKPTYGGYSNEIIVREEFVLRIPDHMDLAKAAPLLCAGITTYSPLRYFNIDENSKVGIIGFGGLGHVAVKIAHQLGAEVTVFSHSKNKKSDALAFGAHTFIDTGEKNFENKVIPQDMLLWTASDVTNIDAYILCLKHDGAMVMIGLPGTNIKLNPMPLIIHRKQITGSLIGGIQQTQEMLDFCGKHDIAPEIEMITPSEINKSYTRIGKSDVRYRFVIDLKK